MISLQAQGIAVQHQVKYNLAYWAEGVNEITRSLDPCKVREFQSSSSFCGFKSEIERGRFGAAVKLKEFKYVSIAQYAVHRQAEVLL